MLFLIQPPDLLYGGGLRNQVVQNHQTQNRK